QLAEAAKLIHEMPVTLREVITAGEQLQITPAIQSLFERLPDCTLHNHYGPSETHVVTAYTLSGAPGEWLRLPPIGRPIDGVKCYAVNEQLQPVAAAETGELLIGGICLARGYINRPDLTAERFLPNPLDPNGTVYRTGDLVRQRSDGE